MTRDGLFKAIVNSKEIGNTLVQRFGGFRTLSFSDGSIPHATIPVLQLRSSGYDRNFLQAAFSCDGGVSLYPAFRRGKNERKTFRLIRTIFLACNHKQLRTDYLTLLRWNGIRAREVPCDRKIKIETERDIRLFQERIGFVKGVTATLHSKFWFDYEKQSILNLMIESYRQPAIVYQLPQFQEVMR
ncbi:hypothetical protein HY623_02810 [Candidatus Uhrbacteria bacterium]|nr:hypothetical protein [Candidatus Uhrbacteria bacterium]